MGKNLFVASAALLSITASASAQTTFKSAISTLLGTVFNSLMGLATVVAAAAFSFGVYKYIMGARGGDSKQIEKGNSFLLWGGITLFVMASIWGIISFGQNIFGIQSAIRLPDGIPARGSSGNYSPGVSSVRIGSSPLPSSQASPQVMQAAAAISQQARSEGKPLPQSMSACTQGGFLASLCGTLFGSGSSRVGSSAFNNGCDPQDPSCTSGSSGVGSSAFNNGCDPQDVSCQSGVSGVGTSAFNNGCDPQDASCSAGSGSVAGGGSSPDQGSYGWYDDGATTPGPDTESSAASYDWYDAGAGDSYDSYNSYDQYSGPGSGGYDEWYTE